MVPSAAALRRCIAALCLIVAVLASAAPAWSDESHSGRLEIRHSDDWTQNESSTRYTLHERSKRIPVSPTSVPRVPSGSRVVIRGTKRSGVLRGDVKARPGVRAAAAKPLGTWRTAVLLFNFTNNRTEPWTTGVVNQRFFTDSTSTNVFFQEQSWNQVNLAGDVYGWYKLAQSNNGCNVDAWAKEADALATAAGVNLDGYDSVAYVFPKVNGCGWSGLAEMPGDQLWLNGDISTRVASHELGHNMGVHHAAALACPGAAVGGSCTTHEYGDPFSSMGSASRRMASWHLEQLGYMGSNNVRSVTGAGTYTIRTSLTQTSEPQLLKIPRQSNSSPAEYYYVDLRTSGGVFDNYSLTSPIVKGITIRIGNDRNVLRQSKLIDTTPDSSSNTLSDFNDAPLAVGRTFTDGNVSITTQSIAGGVATVNVSWAPPADTQAPSAPANLAGSDDGAGITLNWSASTDNVGVAGYRVKRDSQTIATLTGTSYRDTAIEPGQAYSYCIEAFDAAGNTAASPYCTVPARYVPPPPPASAPPAQEPRDRARPTVTIHSPGRNATLRKLLKVRASAADNGRVIRMDLIAGRRHVATKKGAALNVAWKIRDLKPGRHTLTVVAYDAGGNQAQRSVAVRIKR